MSDSDQRLTGAQAADLAGVKIATWDSYVSRGYAPAPDGWFGRQRYWHRATIEQWKASRPGRGTRTDLQQD